MLIMNKIFIIIVVLLLSVLCFAPAVENKRPSEGKTTYEIDAGVVGEYKTDASRAIEAYERLMDKYMSLNETYLVNLSRDVSVLSAKVDALSQQLSQISEKLDRMQVVKPSAVPAAHETQVSQPNP